MEEPIIEPVSKELLRSELTPERQLRMTNKSNNEIYIITAHNAPNVMREIGRLREIAFREAGGGTGKPMDIDEFDTCANCYKQLIVWNPEAEEIIGGYRYMLGTDWELDENRQPKLATSHMFHFSEKFINDYMPYTIELGRSFVTLEYQSTRRGAKSLFALDNLWDGLGALTVIKPNVKYFFGKMTMYPSYIRRGRDMILYFLKKHFDDKDNLIIPLHPLKIETPEEELAALFCEDDFKKDYLILNHEIRALGYNIPPLVNAYMSLSPTMKLFGTAINYGFGDVEETGILIAVDEILENKRVRHIDSFIKEHPEALKITSGARTHIERKASTDTRPSHTSHAPLTHPSTHPSRTPHTPPTHLPRTFFPTPSAYFTIRIGRRRHPYRSTQTSVTVDADIRIGRRGCPNLPYSNIFFALIICKFQIILLYLQPSRRHKQPNTNIFKTILL